MSVIRGLKYGDIWGSVDTLHLCLFVEMSGSERGMKGNSDSVLLSHSIGL